MTKIRQPVGWGQAVKQWFFKKGGIKDAVSRVYVRLV